MRRDIEPSFTFVMKARAKYFYICTSSAALILISLIITDLFKVFIDLIKMQGGPLDRLPARVTCVVFTVVCLVIFYSGHETVARLCMCAATYMNIATLVQNYKEIVYSISAIFCNIGRIYFRLHNFIKEPFFV